MGIVIVRLLIDFAANIAIWLSICCLVAFIIAKVRKSESIRPYFQKAAWAALAVACLATIPLIIRDIGQVGQRPVVSARLSEQQMARFQEILRGVLGDPNFLTPAIHQEFRQILQKMGGSPAELQNLREKMTGLVTTYQPRFWKDVLVSLQTGRPHKSRQRDEYEKSMIAKGLISTERVTNNDALLVKIAVRERVSRDGQQILFDEEKVQDILKSIEETARRVDVLFSKAPR